MRRPRRPLVLMQPKSLLRLPAAASKLEDLATRHVPAGDRRSGGVAASASRCSASCSAAGKMYYDLVDGGAAGERRGRCASRSWRRGRARSVGDRRPVSERRRSGVGAGRAEEHGRVDLRRSRGCARRSATLTTLRYIGRPERASPAEGYETAHDDEQARIVKDVLTLRVGAKKKAGAAR